MSPPTATAAATAAGALAVATLLALAQASGVAAETEPEPEPEASTTLKPPSASAPLQAIIWRPLAEENWVTGEEVDVRIHPWSLLHGTHSAVHKKKPMRSHLQCSCTAAGSCGCCAPIEVPQVGFSQTVCLNLTFHPEDLTVTVSITVNGNTIASTSLSGNSPPPLCLPVPQFPLLMLCVRLTEVGVSAGGLRACVNLEVRLQSATLLVVRFQCVRVGAGGVTVEPRPPGTPALSLGGNTLPASAQAPAPTAARPGDPDYHDPVAGLPPSDVDAAGARGPRGRRIRLLRIGRRSAVDCPQC